MPSAVNWQLLMNEALAKLKEARAARDELRAALAEAALNDVMDRADVTLGTRNNKETT